MDPINECHNEIPMFKFNICSYCLIFQHLKLLTLQNENIIEPCTMHWTIATAIHTHSAWPHYLNHMAWKLNNHVVHALHSHAP